MNNTINELKAKVNDLEKMKDLYDSRCTKLRNQFLDFFQESTVSLAQRIKLFLETPDYLLWSEDYFFENDVNSYPKLKLFIKEQYESGYYEHYETVYMNDILLGITRNVLGCDVRQYDSCDVDLKLKESDLYQIIDEILTNGLGKVTLAFA